MNSLLQSLRNLGPVRLAAIAGVGIATLLFFGFLISRWSTPNMALLYGDLDLHDSSQVVAKLEAMNVPYQLKGDGAQILVPADQVARLRMTMAEQGLPRGGSIGYEIFDKGESLGTSTFQQNINQMRALEGELARTISSLGTVQSARVHLVLPQHELFSREKQEPSASIVVKLRGNDRLSKAQVAAIQHLVAAAVPDLHPNRVVIVDADGTLLARDSSSGDTAAAAGQDYEDQTSAYESKLGRTVEDMLERSLGPGKARVEVRADMDFDRVTTNTETYDPDGQVVRSTQSVTENADSGENAGDQPVSVSTNLPDAQTAKPAPSASGSRSKTGHNEETTNYEISKTVKSHVREGGVVRRLSVAVLVDGNYTTGTDGARTYQPRSPEELQQLATLVRSAIGYDQKRGDTVEVVNLRFASAEEPAAEPAATVLLGLTKDDLLRIGESGALVLAALLVIFLVVRPVMNRVFETMPVPALATFEPQRLLTHQDAGATALPPPEGALMPAPRHLDEIEQMIDIGQVEGRVRASSLRKIGEIVDKHPEEAIAIVRSWMYQRD
ncbi:MAG: flagellar M-ring protein FliF [Alphaproteobacteria bacterium]|nr:flagellar M-ring protein FliF [Alphaproteobacteria bacterium]